MTKTNTIKSLTDMPLADKACEVMLNQGAQENNTHHLFHEARHLIGTTFAKQEPITCWIIDVFRDADEKTREELGSFFLGFELANNVPHGTIIGRRDAYTGELQGSVVLREYNSDAKQGWWHSVSSTWNMSWAFAVMAMHDPVPSILTDGKHKNEMKHLNALKDVFEDQMPKWHKQYGPTGPHWYINCVAVSPKAQGQGLCGKMMRKINDAADASQMPCYLETVGSRNIAIYQRLGYKITGEATVNDTYDPTHAPLTVTFMVRMPGRPKAV